MTRNPNASFTPRVIAVALVAQNGPVDACRKLNAVVRQGDAQDAATLDRCREAHAIILAANGWLDLPNGWDEWFAAADAATPAVRRLCLDLLLDAGSDLLDLNSPDIEV